MNKVSSIRVASRGLIALLVGALVVALGAGPALAGSKRLEQTAFGSLAAPGAVAVDQSGGDVYVVDPGSATVQRFDADGNPVAFSALNGQNTLNGSDAGPDADQTPANAFGFDAASQVAIDASGTATDGTIYVADSSNQVVDIFAASGAYLGQLDGSGTPQGKWADTGAYPCGVAVGADGKVYVSTGMGNQINRYTPAASPVVEADYDSQIDAVPFGSCSLAVDSTGAVYAAPTIFGASGPLVRLAASDFGTSAPAGTQVAANATAVAVDPANDHVIVDEGDKATEHTSSGSQVGASFGAGNLSGSHGIAITTSSDRVYASDQPSTQVHGFGPPVTVADVTLGSATAIADETATLHGTVNPDGVAVTDCHFEYGADASYGQSAACSPGPGAGSSPVAVSADLAGLTAGTTYHYRLSVTNVNGTVTSEDQALLTTSLADVETLYAQPITTDSATIAGQVFRHSQPDTTYHFEWGIDDSYGHSTPGLSGDTLADEGWSFVSEQLTGLQPATTYHFRLVATNATGTVAGDDHTLQTRPSTAPLDSVCPNAAIRAQQHAEHLPECRAYEQVSPQDKKDVSVAVPGSAGGDSPSFGQTPASGGSVAYATIGAYPGADSDTRASFAVARREAEGWTNRSLDPPVDAPSAFIFSPVVAISPDVSTSLVWSKRALTEGAVAGRANLYLRDNGTGSYRLVATSLTEVFGVGASPPFLTVLFAGGNADFSRVFFQSTDALTADAPTDLTKLYEWTSAGLRYVGIIGTDLSSPIVPTIQSQYTADRWPMSTDGSRYFLDADNRLPLYMVRPGLAPVALSISHRPGDPPTPQSASFLGSSNDGRTVVFSSVALLAPDARPGVSGLYRLDVDSGHIETLNAGVSPNATGTPVAMSGLNSVPAISDDARTVFFANGNPNSNMHSLYANREGATRLIATLTTTDSGLPATPQSSIGAEVSPSGRWLLFASNGSLTATGGGDVNEFYLYDADLRRVVCVSCGADGAPSQGTSRLAPRIPAEHRKPRYVLDDGRVFFDTATSLVASDVNGKTDVYEWLAGRPVLISSGKGAYNSAFLDASADGRDVFISTREQLVPQDRDRLTDVYDVRVDGGFLDTSADKAVVPCTGDGCQSDPSPQPSLDLAGSISFTGAANVTADASGSPTSKVTVSRLKTTTTTQARLRVRVPAAGRLSVTGAGLKSQRSNPSRAGSYVIAVSLTQRARSRLQRARRLSVPATLVFSPSAGKPSKVTVMLTFKAASTRKGR